MEKRKVTIERNAIEVFFMAIKDYIKHHRRPAILITLLVLILSAGTIFGALYYEKRSNAELRSYEEIVGTYEKGPRGDAEFNTMMTKLIKLVDSTMWGYVNKNGAYIIAGLYFDKKKYAEALPYYEKYSKTSAAFAKLAVFQAGICAEELGNTDKALEIYKNAEPKFKDTPYADRIYYDLGRIYQKKGDIINAREYLNRVVTLYPQSPFVQNAKARMFLLGIK